MPKYPLTDLNQGMNRHQAPEALPPQFLSNAIGVDIFKPGVLKPLPGGRKLSSVISGVSWMEVAWTGGVYTIYYTTSSGLYRFINPSTNYEGMYVEAGLPGDLIDSDITGQFSVAVLNNVAYIASSVKRLRDDGTTVTQWGIDKPNSAPTLSAVAYSSYSIDACESTTGWTIDSGTMSLSTIAMQGSRSISLLAGTLTTSVITNTSTIVGTYSETGSSGSLIDTTVNFASLGLIIGTSTVTNATDTSTMIPESIITTTNAGDTVTGTLAGGSSNYWDTADEYSFTVVSTATATTAVGDGMRITAIKTGTWDLMHFGSGGSTSDEQDYIELNIRYINIRDLTQVVLSFDCNDGTFATDGYYYLIPLESVSASIQSTKPGTSGLFSGITGIRTPKSNLSTSRYSDGAQLGYTSPTYDTSDGATFSPFTAAAAISGYPYVRIAPGIIQRITVSDNDRWITYRVHKSEFVRYGETDGADWSTIRGISIAVQAAPGKGGNILVDSINLIGGGKHSGQYYGMYAYAVADSEGNTIRLSGCSDISTIIEPDQQIINWSISTSSDSQVNQRVLFITGGLLNSWYCAGKVNDNTSITSQTTIADWEYQDIIDNYYPEMTNYQGIQTRDPRDINAPQAFTKVVNYQDRIWGFGVSGQENYLWSSSRMRGDDMPELASVVVTHRGEVIKNAVPTTSYLHLRGDIRELRLVMGDPGDLSTVSLTPIEGDFASVGPHDAARCYGAQIAGVSTNELIVSDGVSSKPGLEGLVDLVDHTDADLENASVVSMGRYLFASLPTTDGDRTIMVDFLNGARPVYIWDRMFTCLSANVQTKRLYGIYDGTIWELFGVYGWREADGTLIEGTTFQATTANLGLADYTTVESVRLKYVGSPSVSIYMDDTLKNTHALSAVTTKTETRMGASKSASGRFLQLDFTDTVDTEGQPTIHLPIIIYHAPGEDG